MENLNVEIVELQPLRVATFLGFGKNPEDLAFRQMAEFAHKNNLLNGGELPITYGFNNPDPSPGSPNYGYELWLPIPNGMITEKAIPILDFPGGLYAVTRFQGIDKIGTTWQELVRWQEQSNYRRGNHQWLEKLLNPSEINFNRYIFELYLPIESS